MAQVHNLRRQNVILTLATFAIAFSSCQRQISASFLSDKTEYDAGDIVKLTNKSTNAKTYKWTLPDGQIATSEHVDFPIALSQQDGSLTFKLEAFSKCFKLYLLCNLFISYFYLNFLRLPTWSRARFALGATTIPPPKDQSF